MIAYIELTLINNWHISTLLPFPQTNKFVNQHCGEYIRRLVMRLRAEFHHIEAYNFFGGEEFFEEGNQRVPRESTWQGSARGGQY